MGVAEIRGWVFFRDKKGGSGWPVDRRGHARIGSQGYQSTEDKQHQQRRWRQRLRDDQEVQARHIQCEMGRLWKHKSQRRYHVHVCRGDRLLRRAGSRETDRYTLEGPNHHANRVDGRGWASGAYFGALAVVMVVGGICECSLQSNWSVAKAGFCHWVLQLFLQQFLQLQGSLQPAALCQKGFAPREIMGCGQGT